MTNLSTRVLVGFTLGPLVLLCVYVGSWLLLGLTLLISVVATWESFMMLVAKNIKPNFLLGFLLAILIPLSFITSLPNFKLLFILGIFVFSVFELFRNKENPIMNLSSSLFMSGYISIGIGSLLGIRELLGLPQFDEAFAWLALSIIFSIWMCDSFAYFGGRLMGRTKLMPRVSPNKTWEGAIWGLIASMVTTTLFFQFSPMNGLPMTVNEAATMGLLIGMFGQVGDLIESLFKRDAGVKDSSHLIPGHGGLFDRFDSLIFVSPVLFLYLRYIVFPE